MRTGISDRAVREDRRPAGSGRLSENSTGCGRGGSQTRANVDPGVVSARFHDTVAAATAEKVASEASARGLGTAVLSGGVFLNRRLLEGTAARLRDGGLRVLVPERLPPGDGGIAYGQAAVAAAIDNR